MLFTDAYAAAPVCSPTRASLMTGKYPARLHLTDYIPGRAPGDRRLLTPNWRKSLPLEEVTLAEALKQQGYACGHFGKWHLNWDKSYKPGRPGDPGSQGFDDVLTTHKPGAGPASPLPQDWHHVRRITNRAIEFIERHRERPFFCYVTHNTIHRPLHARAELVRKYMDKQSEKPDKTIALVAAMVERLDTSVGRLLAALDELALDERTMVIFYGDNGSLYGPEGATPYSGRKGQLNEGGIREPLVIRWPGSVTPGSKCDVPVTTVDFFPTLLAAAGADDLPPNLDGVNLLPVLTGTGSIERDAIFWHFPHYHSAGNGPSGAVRQGRWKLIEWFDMSVDDAAQPGALQLFDLQEDPAERKDLSSEMPQRVTQLHERLQAWRKKVGAQMMKPNPTWKHGITAGSVPDGQ
jgi:arylsulfatase A-like enzyme